MAAYSFGRAVTTPKDTRSVVLVAGSADNDAKGSTPLLAKGDAADLESAVMAARRHPSTIVPRLGDTTPEQSG
jgi:hypothetical protein